MTTLTKSEALHLLKIEPSITDAQLFLCKLWKRNQITYELYIELVNHIETEWVKGEMP